MDQILPAGRALKSEGDHGNHYLDDKSQGVIVRSMKRCVHPGTICPFTTSDRVREERPWVVKPSTTRSNSTRT